MIYITGDTHGSFHRLKWDRLKKMFPEIKPSDYIIQLGDFGLVWSESTLDSGLAFLKKTKCRILWVQGNHENYDMLAKYPLEDWNGGKVRHIIRDKVILLERGQIFEIEGKTFFTLGGARSHDISGGIYDPNDLQFENKIYRARLFGVPFRIKGQSWWDAEMPTQEEMDAAYANLESHDFKVDYILTHDCSTRIQDVLDPGPWKVFEVDQLNAFFDKLEDCVDYKHWFFGHYHEDWHIDKKHTALYTKIIPLQNEYVIISKDPTEQYDPGYAIDDMVTFLFDGNLQAGIITEVHFEGNHFDYECSYDIIVSSGYIAKDITESDICGIVNC